MAQAQNDKERQGLKTAYLALGYNSSEWGGPEAMSAQAEHMHELLWRVGTLLAFVTQCLTVECLGLLRRTGKSVQKPALPSTLMRCWGATF